MTEQSPGDGGPGNRGTRAVRPPFPRLEAVTAAVTALVVPGADERSQARALHPAGGRFRWPKEPEGGRGTSSASRPGPPLPAGAMAVLWDMATCLDHLRCAPVGLLSYRAARGPVSATVACVADGEDILLILPASAALDAGTRSRPASLVVTGTDPVGSWLVRVRGSIEAVVLGPAAEAASTGGTTKADDRRRLAALDLGSYRLVALTPTGLQGYQHRLS